MNIENKIEFLRVRLLEIKSQIDTLEEEGCYLEEELFALEERRNAQCIEYEKDTCEDRDYLLKLIG